MDERRRKKVIEKIGEGLGGTSLVFSGDADINELRERGLDAFNIMDLKLVDHEFPSQVTEETMVDTKVSKQAAVAAAPPVDISPHRIPTKDVIESLMRAKVNRRLKEGSIATYRKKMAVFERSYPLLPETEGALLQYLARFDGETGRHRLNHLELLKMIYRHAKQRFGLPNDPTEWLERPLITHKVVRPLTRVQARLVLQTPQNLSERVALELLLGHGWRQIEVRRVLAKDVDDIADGLILVHGKEQNELTPILPQTVDGLREMAAGLKPSESVFVSMPEHHRGPVPLGEDGIARMIARFYKRAELGGFTGHDLRRTFATMVTENSGDEFLANRLIRDRIPGMSRLYIRYPMDKLVTALQMHSPVSMLQKIEEQAQPEPANEAVTVTSPASNGGDGTEVLPFVPEKLVVEAGEG